MISEIKIRCCLEAPYSRNVLSFCHGLEICENRLLVHEVIYDTDFWIISLFDLMLQAIFVII